MATQADGILINDWSKFAQQMIGTYAVNKMGNPGSVVPRSDVGVVSAAATPTTQVASVTNLGAFVKTPMGMAVAAGFAIGVFYLFRKVL